MLFDCTPVIRNREECSLQAVHCNLRECKASLELLFGRCFAQWSIGRRKCASRQRGIAIDVLKQVAEGSIARDDRLRQGNEHSNAVQEIDGDIDVVFERVQLHLS